MSVGNKNWLLPTYIVGGYKESKKMRKRSLTYSGPLNLIGLTTQAPLEIYNLNYNLYFIGIWASPISILYTTICISYTIKYLGNKKLIPTFIISER